MLTNAELSEIIGRVRYKAGWSVILAFRPMALGEAADPSPYIQVRCSLEREPWSGRKWLLSRHSTVSEVVTTCFKAILTAEEHEAREFFTYRDQPVFGPHFDVEKLVDLARDQHYDVRQDAMEGAA